MNKVQEMHKGLNSNYMHVLPKILVTVIGLAQGQHLLVRHSNYLSVIYLSIPNQKYILMGRLLE